MGSSWKLQKFKDRSNKTSRPTAAELWCLPAEPKGCSSLEWRRRWKNAGFGFWFCPRYVVRQTDVPQSSGWPYWIQSPRPQRWWRAMRLVRRRVWVPALDGSCCFQIAEVMGIFTTFCSVIKCRKIVHLDSRVGIFPAVNWSSPGLALISANPFVSLMIG